MGVYQFKLSKTTSHSIGSQTLQQYVQNVKRPLSLGLPPCSLNPYCYWGRNQEAQILEEGPPNLPTRGCSPAYPGSRQFAELVLSTTLFYTWGCCSLVLVFRAFLRRSLSPGNRFSASDKCVFQVLVGILVCLGPAFLILGSGPGSAIPLTAQPSDMLASSGFGCGSECAFFSLEPIRQLDSVPFPCFSPPPFFFLLPRGSAPINLSLTYLHIFRDRLSLVLSPMPFSDSSSNVCSSTGTTVISCG